MQEILDFLQKCQVFYLATMDGEQARVRPMGFAMEYQGKLCFGTNNTKEMYKQMKAQPKIEICVTNEKMQTLRASGEVFFIPDREAKVKALQAMPSLRAMYSEDDGIFEIFAFSKATATISDMQGNQKTIII